jgi:hypothetical protein
MPRQSFATGKPDPTKREDRMSRRLFAAASVVAVAALVSAVAAFAGSPPGTVTFTQHAHNVVLFSDPSANPCTGEPGTVTGIAKNEVFHVTEFTAPGRDEFWVTGTDEGTVTFTPDDPNGVSASGHFASWFGESANNKNDVQHDIFNATLTGSDGSHIGVHGVDHLSTNANGVVTVLFEKMTMSCG